MQVDFVTGALKNDAAQAIVPGIVYDHIEVVEIGHI